MATNIDKAALYNELAAQMKAGIESGAIVPPGPPTIVQTLAAVIGALPVIGKDRENREQGFKFQGIDDVIAELKPLAAEHGLLIAPEVLERETEKRMVGRDGAKVMHVVNLHVGFTFYGPAGDAIHASAWGEGSDMGDKSTAKAMTGAFKSVLRQVLLVADSAATDADFSTPEDTVAPAPARDLPNPEVVLAFAERLKALPEERRAEVTKVWLDIDPEKVWPPERLVVDALNNFLDTGEKPF